MLAVGCCDQLKCFFTTTEIKKKRRNKIVTRKKIREAMAPMNNVFNVVIGQQDQQIKALKK